MKSPTAHVRRMYGQLSLHLASTAAGKNETTKENTALVLQRFYSNICCTRYPAYADKSAYYVGLMSAEHLAYRVSSTVLLNAWNTELIERRFYSFHFPVN